MAAPPDEPPDEPEWLKELANRVRPPDTPVVLQAGKVEHITPFPSTDTKQQVFIEARDQLRKDGVFQTPDQKISAETHQTFARAFGNGAEKTIEPAPEGPTTPTDDPDLTPGD